MDILKHKVLEVKLKHLSLGLTVVFNLSHSKLQST